VINIENQVEEFKNGERPKSSKVQGEEREGSKIIKQNTYERSIAAGRL